MDNTETVEALLVNKEFFEKLLTSEFISRPRLCNIFRTSSTSVIGCIGVPCDSPLCREAQTEYILEHLVKGTNQRIKAEPY